MSSDAQSAPALSATSVLVSTSVGQSSGGEINVIVVSDGNNQTTGNKPKPQEQDQSSNIEEQSRVNTLPEQKVHTEPIQQIKRTPDTSNQQDVPNVVGVPKSSHVIRLRPCTSSAAGIRRRKSFSLSSAGAASQNEAPPGGVAKNQQYTRDAGHYNQGVTSQQQTTSRRRSSAREPQSPPVLVSIMKRPSTTPGLSPSMRAAIAVNTNNRHGRRHVMVKTHDGKEIRTRDSSGDSSRASSPEPDNASRSSARSRLSRSASDWDGGSGSRQRLRSISAEGGRRLPVVQPPRPQTSPGRPVSYRLSVIKQKIMACRSMIAMGKTSSSRKDETMHGEQAGGTERAKSASAAERGIRDSPLGGHRLPGSGQRLRSTSLVTPKSKAEDDDSGIPPSLVYGTESYYEVINRLCRPTVASVAHASMKLIRARGNTQEELPVNTPNNKREPPPWLTEEYLSRRFLGEQRLTPEEVEEIVLRLCQPVTSSFRTVMDPQLHDVDVNVTTQSRLPLRRPHTTRFGIVQSYMWTCGDKMEQNQWERKSIELRIEQKIASLHQPVNVNNGKIISSVTESRRTLII